MPAKDTVLLTGATGALGSIILRRLVKENYKVFCIVRGKNRVDAARRIERIVGRNLNVKAIRGDITEPRCGISDLDREQMFGRVKRILHCAASISFGDREATYKANVNGVHHMLELADVLDVWQVTHISTAYVAGNADRFAEDNLPSSIQFRPRNYYEETKQLGETMVRAWALKRDDRRTTILRPSILIGCQDGTSPTFDAYYGYFKPIHRVAAAMRSRFAEGKQLPDGVVVNQDWVDIPLVLRAGTTSTLNLIPIDWCADTMVALFDTPPRNEVYHIVNTSPPLVRWVIDTSLRYLKIRGVLVVSTVDEKTRLVAKQSPLVAKLQSQIDRVLDQYIPYTNHSTVFAMERTPNVLKSAFAPQPKLDVAFMERLLEFALKADWGQKALEPA